MEIIICPHCGKDHAAGTRFCPSTGLEIAAPTLCRSCGKPVEAGWQICAHCGQALDTNVDAARIRSKLEKPLTLKPISTYGVFVLLLVVVAVFSVLIFRGFRGKENSPDKATAAVPSSTGTGPQPTPPENLQIPVDEANVSPVTIEIYEYKEGLTPGNHFVRQGDGWKPYHVKFRVVANSTIPGQNILNIGQYNIGDILAGSSVNNPHIITAEGYEYGNTSETFGTFDFGFPDPAITHLDLFTGIPLMGYRTKSGNVMNFEANFSVPQKLTPEKLVIPRLEYSIDLPPLGTENFSEILIPTEQTVDFPTSVVVNPNIDIKVSNFVENGAYVTIDYEITNKNFAADEYGFFYAALVDSYGFVSRHVIVRYFGTHSECSDIQMILSPEDITAGPGQSKSGVLCFKKNTEYRSSFYVLYFSHLGSSGPDNRAILITPSGVITETTSSPSSNVSTSSTELNGTWQGEWTNPAGYLYTCEIIFGVDQSNNIDGHINWTLKKSPNTGEQSKIGLTGIEYIRGTYDPQTRLVIFQGYRKDDPYSILGLDNYRLSLSVDGNTLSGSTENNGDWQGQLTATHKP